jgi:hypothetical protein
VRSIDEPEAADGVERTGMRDFVERGAGGIVG